MKKKLTVIGIISVVTVAVVAVGIGVNANQEKIYPRQEAYADSWYRKADAEPTKVIQTEEPVAQKEDVSAEKKESSSEQNDKELTYVITNGSDEANPLDIYQDENKNEYRYNQDGELDTYKQSFSNREVLGPDEEPYTEDGVVALARKYLNELYGERMRDMELDFSRFDGAELGYMVVFAKKYGVDGFIEHAGAMARIAQNGDLIISTIVPDLMEDFDEKRVADLTLQEVKDRSFPMFEKEQKNCAKGSAEIYSVQLVRENDGFALSVLIDYKTESGFEGSGKILLPIE